MAITGLGLDIQYSGGTTETPTSSDTVNPASTPTPAPAPTSSGTEIMSSGSGPVPAANTYVPVAQSMGPLGPQLINPDGPITTYGLEKEGAIAPPVTASVSSTSTMSPTVKYGLIAAAAATGLLALYMLIGSRKKRVPALQHNPHSYSSRSRFVHREIEPSSHFKPESIRTIKRHGVEFLIGRPKERYMGHTGSHGGATRAIAELRPVENPYISKRAKYGSHLYLKLKQSLKEKTKAGWARDIGAGFIAEDIDGVSLRGNSVHIITPTFTQNIPIKELNLRETEELIKAIKKA